MIRYQFVELWSLCIVNIILFFISGFLEGVKGSIWKKIWQIPWPKFFPTQSELLFIKRFVCVCICVRLYHVGHFSSPSHLMLLMHCVTSIKLIAHTRRKKTSSVLMLFSSELSASLIVFELFRNIYLYCFACCIIH